MKKFLLLLLTSGLFLSSCALFKKNNTSGGDNSGEVTPPTPSGGDTDPEEGPEDDPPTGPVYHDIVLSFTVSGIDTYEGDHAKIWINGDNVDCSKTGYESKVLTQDEENPNLWSVTLLNYELEQTLTYNLYYGGEEEGSIEWNKGCNTEGDKENNRTLETFENKFTYDGLTATFDVPEIDGTLEEIKFVMTPLVKASSTSDATALPDGVVVYAYNDFDKVTSKLVKEDDGTWSLTLTNVPTINGKAVVQVNPVLGTSSGANYEKVGEFNRYGMGVYEGSTWQYWKDGDSYAFSSETLVVSKEILFREAPEVPAETFTVTFVTSVS